MHHTLQQHYPVVLSRASQSSQSQRCRQKCAVRGPGGLDSPDVDDGDDEGQGRPRSSRVRQEEQEKSGAEVAGVRRPALDPRVTCRASWSTPQISGGPSLEVLPLGLQRDMCILDVPPRLSGTVLMLRPRAWNMVEKEAPWSLFDFGLLMFPVEDTV
ncbi:malate synthase, glyoxysomal-like protein [Lates japonicus]|uniref:Malate synthase, glyoxysomal-like protein n=1 Tax=Lates japonicus TaxID=270547 RepID=A0AAD3MZY9_LATJO|nr:malate synthase, glyoxysomal-like protein [Lates japonicus]